MNSKIIIAITGASGAIYGIRLLEILKNLNIETHLVISKMGIVTIEHETTYTTADVAKLANYYYNGTQLGAVIASGSNLIQSMIIAPCSMRSLAAIANGLEDNLITRAASVVLKERRKLILLTRETPLHLAHINNMYKVTEMGGIIAPPVPAFYQHPQTIDDIVNFHIARMLELVGITIEDLQRWNGLKNQNANLKK